MHLRSPLSPPCSQERLFILQRNSVIVFLQSTSSRHKMDVEMKDGKLKSFIRLGMHKRHWENVIRKTIKVLLYALEMLRFSSSCVQFSSLIDWSRNCCRAVKDLMRISREIIRRKSVRFRCWFCGGCDGGITTKKIERLLRKVLCLHNGTLLNFASEVSWKIHQTWKFFCLKIFQWNFFFS